MIRRIAIDFDTSPRSDAIRVVLTFSDHQGQEQRCTANLNRMPNTLHLAFQRWQRYVNSGTQEKLRKIRVETDDSYLQQQGDFAEGNVNFTTLANQLLHQLNLWLSDQGWLEKNKIRHELEQYYERINFQQEEVQIVIQTEHELLRQIPWQEWEVLKQFCDRGAEVTLSASEYRRPNQQNRPQLKARVRILVVFGNDLLVTEEEKTLISELPKYGGEIEILTEPTRGSLEKTLQDPQGWHIFFFAGHSGSNADKKLAWLEICPTEKLSIEELLSLFQSVINDKLQLAIFNSCDGLGLANQLTALSLPYCIVMREEVESSLARNFLPQFLHAFVKGDSLFTSMWKARRFLKQEFDIKRQHPGKSWLPVVISNPLADSLTWDGMFTERRFSRKWEYLLVGVTFVITLGLPLSIWLEFGLDSLVLYARLYPHMVFYPSVFLWVAMYSIYRMAMLIRQKTRSLIMVISAILLLTSMALASELHSDPIFLYEIKPNITLSASLDPETRIDQIDGSAINSQSNDEIKIEKNRIVASVKSFISSDEKIFPLSNPKLMEIILSHNTLKINKEYVSTSRWFYGFTYFGILASVLSYFPLLYTILQLPSSVFKKNKYFAYLLLQTMTLLPWISCHFYYTLKTKELLFDDQFNPFATNLYPYIYVCVFSIIALILGAGIKIRNSEYRVFFISLIIASVTMTFLAGTRRGLTLIDHAIGMQSNSVTITWLGGFFISAFIFVLLSNLIDKKVEEDWNDG